MSPCATPGCPELVDSGRCAAHRLERDRARPNERQRGYTARVRNAMEFYKRGHPICERCRTAVTQICDHITPISQGGDPMGPFQALCRPCHGIKTVEDQRNQSRRVANV